MAFSCFVISFLSTILTINGIYFTHYDETNTYCIVDNNSSITSPIVISPPNGENFKEKLETVQQIWNSEQDNWIMKDATNYIQGPVTDKRFQDFDILEDNILNLELVESLSFSVYSSSSVEIYLYDDPHSPLAQRLVLHRGNSKKEWIHYSLVIQNSSLFITEDGVLQNKLDNFRPQKVTLKSMNTTSATFWKIHRYTFRWSDQVTKYQPASVTHTSCIILYAYLCHSCSLEVSTSIQEQHGKTIEIYGSVTKSWQTHLFQADPGKESQLLFYKRNNRSGNGYWGIDLRKCPNVENDMIVYSTHSGGDKGAVCKMLSDDNKETEAQNSDRIFECKSKNNDCKLDCHNSICVCSSGYHGRLCKHKCQKGKWGPSCQNNCSSECHNCNRVTGTCKVPRKIDFVKLVTYGSRTMIMTAIILSIAIFSVTLKFVWVLYHFFCVRRYRHFDSDNQAIPLVYDW